MARGGDVYRLFEERPVERVGLVEHGQHLERPAHQEGLDGDLGPGYEGLHQEGLEGPDYGPDPCGGRLDLDLVIGPDHSLAP